jgi:ribosomal protein S18
MISKGLWISKKAKKKRIFQQRGRRSSEGELVQINGSIHKCFGETGSKCTLIYTVDNAKEKIQSGRFCSPEMTWDYMELLKKYVTKHGKLLALLY